jgi:hypothetical protein
MTVSKPAQGADTVAAAEARMAAAHENWQHLRFTTGKAWKVYVELRDQWLAAQKSALNDGSQEGSEVQFDPEGLDSL